MLCEGVGQRAVSRLTQTDRKTVARLALASARGCAELHAGWWSACTFTGSNVTSCGPMSAISETRRKAAAKPSPVFGDQYTYVALASATRAIIGYRTGKRDGATTDDFIQDLRGRVIGSPEISTGRLGHPRHGAHYRRQPRDGRQARAASRARLRRIARPHDGRHSREPDRMRRTWSFVGHKRNPQKGPARRLHL